MTLLKAAEFLSNFGISASDTATWIFSFITFIIFIFGIGWIWGKMWNREWSFGGHVSPLILVVFFAFCAAYSVFNLRVVSQLETWFPQQREILSHTVADSGTFNRAVFRSTWDKLAPLGGQNGLKPPDESGNEIRLNSPEDAYALALNAADEVQKALRTKLPFSLGVPVSLRNSTDVAREAVDSVKFDVSRFPTIVPPNNEWASTAAVLQTNYAIDTAYSLIKGNLQDLKSASIGLLIVSFLVVFLTIPICALGDIKVNPRVRV